MLVETKISLMCCKGKNKEPGISLKLCQCLSLQGRWITQILIKSQCGIPLQRDCSGIWALKNVATRPFAELLNYIYKHSSPVDKGCCFFFTLFVKKSKWRHMFMFKRHIFVWLMQGFPNNISFWSGTLYLQTHRQCCKIGNIPLECFFFFTFIY